MKSKLNSPINNQKGVAILLVLGVISLLSFILFEFTFETKLNKIKVFNQQERFQARLNAEAGLNFAMGKLRLYQEGRNTLEKNSSKKSVFPPEQLEDLLIQPFIYPIPLSSKSSIIQQNALKDFEKDTIIRGEIQVTILKISGLLNPNSLRVIDKKAQTQKENIPENLDNQNQENNLENVPNNKTVKNEQESGNENQKKENKWDTAKNLFIKTLTQMIEDKLAKDEEFHNKHANTKVETLVNELIFYVNNANKVSGQEFLDAKAKFTDAGINPKHGPMASVEEFYLLPSWDDTIIGLIKDRISVQEQTTIPVNEINNSELKILFPEINELQMEDFFKYRDGDVDKKIPPSKFKSADDFKSVITGKLNIISESEFQKRMDELKNAGLQIGTAGKLYKVISKGSYNNATYTLNAIVDIPQKEQPPKKGNNPNQPPPLGTPQNQNNTETTAETGTNNGDSTKTKDDTPAEFLLPRIVDIRAE